MSSNWTTDNAIWQSLSPHQKAAAMALMEADSANPSDAKNAAGAMVNRAWQNGQDIGQHVSQRIYQPTIEPAQQARLSSILRNPNFDPLTDWISRRQQGLEDDPVGGATHFLAKPQVMLSLERSNPDKYKNWGPRGANWTGYDSSTGQYKNQTMQDSSHAFLAPDGKASAPYHGGGEAPGQYNEFSSLNDLYDRSSNLPANQQAYLNEFTTPGDLSKPVTSSPTADAPFQPAPPSGIASAAAPGGAPDPSGATNSAPFQWAKSFSDAYAPSSQAGTGQNLGQPASGGAGAMPMAQPRLADNRDRLAAALAALKQQYGISPMEAAYG